MMQLNIEEAAAVDILNNLISAPEKKRKIEDLDNLYNEEGEEDDDEVNEEEEEEDSYYATVSIIIYNFLNLAKSYFIT